MLNLFRSGQPFQNHSLWDLANLLLIPITAAVLGYIITKSRRDEDRRIAQKRINEDRRIAQKVRYNELAIANHREEEKTLLSFFEAMKELLLLVH